MRFILFAILAFAGADRAQAATSPVIVLLGTGAQVYACRPGDDGYDWRLEAPDAVLTDVAGHKVGRHFGGPSWQAEDGSTVVGEPLVASPAPRPGAIPWLVLHAKSHAGDGLFQGVSYIVRSSTAGGVAPDSGCDQNHAGAETRVGYTATYTFFPG